MRANSFVAQRAVDLMLAYGRRFTATRDLRRLLITSTGGLGDGVLLSSLIHHIRASDFAIEIGVMAWFGARQALATLPDLYLHREYELQRGAVIWWPIIRDLRARRYDAVIATDHTALSIAAMLCLAGIPRRVGFAPLCDWPQARLYTDAVPLDEGESQWSSLQRLARIIRPDLARALEVMPLPIAPGSHDTIGRWWSERIPRDARPVATLHLGAGVSYRRWPVARFVELAERLREKDSSMTILLTGRGEEREIIEEFSQSYSGYSIDVAGFTSISEVAAMLQRCDLLVANDCGIMHLGAAMGTPTVGLFGPNTPIQWAPRGPRVSFVYPHDIRCSPCIQNYRGPAPSSCANPVQQQCLLAISVDEVLKAARQVTEQWF